DAAMAGEGVREQERDRLSLGHGGQILVVEARGADAARVREIDVAVRGDAHGGDLVDGRKQAPSAVGRGKESSRVPGAGVSGVPNQARDNSMHTNDLRRYAEPGRRLRPRSGAVVPVPAPAFFAARTGRFVPGRGRWAR